MNNTIALITGIDVLWWWFIAVVIFIALIWLITHQIQKSKQRQASYPRSVEEVLEDRYRRGEITEAEYESELSKLKKQDEIQDQAQVKSHTKLDDQTTVKHTLNSRENPDTPLADAEKPPKG